MANIGFHRTNEQWLVRRAVVREDGSQRKSLDRIADRRAGPVSFDVNDVVRVGASALQGVTDHLLLRLLVRHGEAARMPVLIRRRGNQQKLDELEFFNFCAVCRGASSTAAARPPRVRNHLPRHQRRGIVHAGESICAWLKPIVASGVISALAPQTSAASYPPDQRLCAAKCSATNDEEQAVSTARVLGPRRLWKNEIRFAAIESALPMLVYPSSDEVSRRCSDA